MVGISALRILVKNGWTIANRGNVISQIGKNNFNEIVKLAEKTGRTGDKVRFSDVKSLLLTDSSAVKEALKNPNVSYHGSPFSFDFFDVSKIGSGEGMNKYCKGLYLARTKRIAPFYANIRSKDAPLHFGSTKPLEHTNPTVYTVNMDGLNLKLCTPLEAKNLKRMQADFQTQYPDVDGIELLNGEITVFPESIHKLRITDKKGVLEFVKNNKGTNFREWTTDISKIKLTDQ